MCISHFFADLLLAVYFIFILDYRNNVRQKANSSNFFFFYSSSKWIVKQQGQLATMTMHLAQELLKNVQCSGIREVLQRQQEL